MVARHHLNAAFSNFSFVARNACFPACSSGYCCMNSATMPHKVLSTPCRLFLLLHQTRPSTKVLYFMGAPCGLITETPLQCRWCLKWMHCSRASYYSTRLLTRTHVGSYWSPHREALWSGALSSPPSVSRNAWALCLLIYIAIPPAALLPTGDWFKPPTAHSRGTWCQSHPKVMKVADAAGDPSPPPYPLSFTRSCLAKMLHAQETVKRTRNCVHWIHHAPGSCSLCRLLG